MDKIVFSHNWNGKLNNRAFTTLRRHNPGFYQRKRLYSIYLKDEYKGDALLVDIRTTTIAKLSDFVCLLDTGYDKENAVKIFQRMYSDLDVEYTQFDYLLLMYQSTPMPKCELFNN